jgi:hypothetical protein
VLFITVHIPLECLLPHTFLFFQLDARKTLFKYHEGPGPGGGQRPGRGMTWKCHSFTQVGLCGRERMRTEREYCYVCQRAVPYDKDVSSDGRRRSADREIENFGENRIGQSCFGENQTERNGSGNRSSLEEVVTTHSFV